jgi:hypothetical protein
MHCAPLDPLKSCLLSLGNMRIWRSELASEAPWSSFFPQCVSSCSKAHDCRNKQESTKTLQVRPQRFESAFIICAVRALTRSPNYVVSICRAFSFWALWSTSNPNLGFSNFPLIFHTISFLRQTSDHVVIPVFPTGAKMDFFRKSTRNDQNY